MRAFWVLSVLLLACSAFTWAANDTQAAQVAAAVGSAISASPIPSASPGFVDGRLNDIQNRLNPAGNAFGSQLNPGPNNGPDNGRFQGNGGFGPGQGNFGGDFGPQGNNFPQNGPGFGGPQNDFGPDSGNDFGPGGFGPNQDGFQGPDNKAGQPGFSPNGGPNNNGGPNFGAGSGPNGFQNNPGYGPNQGGGGFAGGPNFGYYQQSGPQDFRGYSQFNLRPIDFEGWVYSEIGSHLVEHYGKDAFIQKCGNQPELANTIMDDMKKSGIDINKLMCAPIQQGLASCQDAQKQCEQIGGSGNGPQFGPSGQTYTPTCPPDENQIKQACLTQFQNQWDRQQSEMTQNMQDQCQIQWQYQQHPQDACVNGQPRKDIMCDHDAWIQDCLSHQAPQGDYPGGNGGPQYPPQGQPPYPQPNYPNNNPNSNGPHCPPLDDATRQNMRQACAQNNQDWTDQVTPDGCPTIQCRPRNQPNPSSGPQASPATCPAPDESAKQRCLSNGMAWNTPVGPNGCPYYQCIPGQPQPSFNPSANPTQSACPPVDQSVKAHCSAWSEQVGPAPSFCPYIRCDQAAQNTAQPTSAGTATPVPSNTAQPTVANTPQPTVASTPAPTQAATVNPTSQASASPVVTTTPSAHAAASNSWYLDSGASGDNNGPNPAGQFPGHGPGFSGPQGPAPNGFVPNGPNPNGLPPGPQGNGGPQFQGNGGPNSGPYGGDQNNGQRLSPQDRCEQQWQRNQAYSAKTCETRNRQPQFNYCDEQAFISQCVAQNQKRMDEQHAQLNSQKICDIQTRMQLRELARYCQNVQGGKDQCLAETKKGCDFGQQNLDKCQQLTATDNVAKTVEKAIALQCGILAGSGQPKALNQVGDLVPANFKPLVQNDAYNVQQAQDAVKQVSQKDAMYALTQMIGLQADQEKKDAALLQSQCEQLKSTADQLSSLSSQLDSSDAKIQLQAQVVLLQQQKDSICSNAKSKHDNAAGIFSILAGLFGGATPPANTGPSPAPS